MTYQYDFKAHTKRKEVGSFKWDQMYALDPSVADEVMPLTVADMEFKTPPEVVEGLKDFLDKAILGYTGPYENFLNAVVEWQKKRHNWEIEKEWIVNTQGVVSALHNAIKAFSKKGDGVIIFRPVYYPFGAAIEANERTEVNVPLLNDNGYYTIDYAGFEKAAAKSENKILLFCSPHNPGGRVWKKEELEKLAEIAIKHQLYVVSDEIWYDLVMPGYTHTVLATINEKINSRLITCTAPSKSFNLAGLMTSNIIISNEDTRNQFKEELEKTHGNMVGILGYKSCELAYTKSEPWLDELLTVIDRNQRLVHDYFKENFPEVHAPLLEGTYVQWVDFSQLNLSNEEIEELFYKEAHFFSSHGDAFGKEGSGYERINIALPTAVLEEALHRLGKILENIKK